jgi:hypothetical protein
VKNPLLQKAAQRLLTAPKFAGLRKLMTKFRADNPWLEDSALFDALRQQPDLVGLDWWEWPEPLRFRKASAIQEAHKQHKQQVDEFVAVQFLFDRQWRALKVGWGGGEVRWGGGRSGGGLPGWEGVDTASGLDQGGALHIYAGCLAAVLCYLLGTQLRKCQL